jgi:hypothetical protein
MQLSMLSEYWRNKEQKQSTPITTQPIIWKKPPPKKRRLTKRANPRKALLMMASRGLPKPSTNSSDPYEKFLADALVTYIRNQDEELLRKMRQINPAWLPEKYRTNE